MNWTKVGIAGRYTPLSPIQYIYTLESSLDSEGIIRYRAKNTFNNAIVPLNGNNGKLINHYIVFDENPENKLSINAYQMIGQPYTLSTELPGIFYVMLSK